MTDTIGLLLGIDFVQANVQDFDCAADLIRKVRRRLPFITYLFADGGYSGSRVQAALADQRVEIVKRTDKQNGLRYSADACVIDRAFTWLRHDRRLMTHVEALAVVAEGFAKLAMIQVMPKRLTRPTHAGSG